jgi:HlyD family secretion protein
MRYLVILLLVLLVVGGALGGWFWYDHAHATVGFKTVAVERGDLMATISATGTIQPEEVVDVGAQVAGMIREFGRDPRDAKKAIDYGSPVYAKSPDGKGGTILAQIDDSLYQADVLQATAQLRQAETRVDQAKANLKKAEADLQQYHAKLDQAEHDYTRSERLRPANVVSQADYEVSKAAYETSKAAIGSGDAAVAQAKAAIPEAEAAVAAAQAMLKRAETNLSYTVIRSPVDGVIVDRRVNIGQTVVSSLNAPSLFLIAKDLTRLQVWASVNEADIGQIHVNQTVRFSVDAYPGEVFTGQVAQIRLNATMTQNVVTYTVVVNTENASGRLLPYMTANLQFEVNKKTDVLLLPNAALRWRPQPQQVVPDARDAFLKAQKKRENGTKNAQGEPEHQTRGVVWLAEDSFVRPVKVQLGLSDGLMTEIMGDALEEGAEIVTGEVRQNSNNGTTNPLAPQVFGGKKQ